MQIHPTSTFPVKATNKFLPKRLRLSAVTIALSATFFASADTSDGAFDGETMVVSGARIEQKLADVAGSVSVVTAQDIDQLMMTDLESLFRYEPGISTTGNGAQPQTITVRGVGGNRLVYIKDGRRSNDGYAGGGGFIVGRGYMNTTTIQQVEVAKGASSSLYGSDGLGGIVVITTKDPEDYLQGEEQHLALSTGYIGSAKEMSVDLAGAIRGELWDFSAAISHRDGNEVQNFGETLPEYDADSQAVLLKAVRRLDAHQRIKLTLDHFQQETDQIIIIGANETQDQDTNTSLSVDYEDAAGGSFWDTLNAQLYMTRYEQLSEQVRYNSRGYTDFNNYRFEQDILGARLVFSKQLKNQNVTHSLVYGLDYDQYDTLRPRLKTRVLADDTLAFSDVPQPAFPGAETLLAGIFVQNNIDVKDSGFSFIMGGRLDRYEMDPKEDPLYTDTAIVPIEETAFSPKVGVIYDINAAFSVYGQYVEGFKIPPHDQAYQSHGVEPFYQILPNADLAAEESQTLEVGIRYHRDALRVELNGFNSDFEHFIESTLVGIEDTVIPGVTKQLFQYQNLDKTHINGLELSAAFTFSARWELTTNLAWAKGENTATGQPLTSISPLQGSMLLKTHWQDWDFTAAWRFAKSMSDVPVDAQGNTLIQSSGYAVVDLYAQYQAGDWRMTAGIENLLNKEYVAYESIAGQPEGTDIGQYTQPGRALSVNFRYEF